jgi:hypothetical protein
MNRLRKYLASYTITPVGAIALLVLLAAMGVFLAGPSNAQMPALIVAVVLLIGILGGVPFSVGTGRFGGGGVVNERRRGFRQAAPQTLDAPAQTSAEAELWRKERERYSEQDRPS